MERSVRFYQALGLSVVFGGEDAPFTTFKVGDGYLNIQFDPDFNGVSHIWGRAVFWVDDVDTVYQDMVDAGYEPNAAPSDAPWGERYFPMRDPDGHDLSFARPLSRVENRDHVDHA